MVGISQTSVAISDTVVIPVSARPGALGPVRQIDCQRRRKRDAYGDAQPVGWRVSTMKSPVLCGEIPSYVVMLLYKFYKAHELNIRYE